MLLIFRLLQIFFQVLYVFSSSNPPPPSLSLRFKQLHTSISLPCTLKKCKSPHESPCRGGSNNCYAWALDGQNAVTIGGTCPKSQTVCGTVIANSDRHGDKDNDNQLLLTSEQGVCVDSSNESLASGDECADMMAQTQSNTTATFNVNASDDSDMGRVNGHPEPLD